MALEPREKEKRTVFSGHFRPVSGSSHFLSLNPRLEIQIFMLLEQIIRLAYLGHGRAGPHDSTPTQWGQGRFIKERGTC